MNDRPPTAAMLLQTVLARHRVEFRNYVGRLLPHELSRAVEPTDLLQEAYIDAIGTASNWYASALADDNTLVRLLKTIIRRNIIDMLRRHRSTRHGQGNVVGINDMLLDSTERLLEQMVLYERTPSESAMSHEVHALVELNLGNLQPDHAAVLKLRYSSGMSLKDVGQQMSRSQEAAEILCRRAITELRSRLSIALPA